MPHLDSCPTCHRPYAKRTGEQNAKMWALLHDLVAQTMWHGIKLTAEEWKTLFTAGLKQQKVIPGLEGGFVVCGEQTSSMSKRELAQLIELIVMFGDQRGVKWTHGN